MKTKKPITTFVLCALGGGVLGTPVVHADEATALPPISITATKTPREVFTTPASVSVVESSQIELQQPDSFVDLLQGVPGTAIQGGARRIAEVPVIRGFSDEQVVIRTDGARRNFNQAHRGRFPVDPELIKRVEVLRGPGSGLYGSGAIGGVIDITTKSALDYLDEDGYGARVGAGYRSNGSEAAGALTGFARSGNVDILGSAILRDRSEDLEDGDGDDIFATEDKVESYFSKLGYSPSDAQRLEVVLDQYTNEGINPPNANEEATPGVTSLVDRDTERRSARVSWSDEAPGNDAVDLEALLYMNESDVRESRLDVQRLDDTEHSTLGFEVMNSTIIDALGARITYGLDYYQDDQTGTRDGAPRPQFPDAESSYRAGYVQGEFEWANGLSLIPTVRVDSFSLDPGDGAVADRDETQVSPSLGVGYRIDEHDFIWAKAAQAFRAPSLTELYADGVHFVAPVGPGEVVVNEFVPTPDLEPEESTSFEVGYRRQLTDLWTSGDLVTFSATAFHNDVENFVDQRVVFISGPPSFDPRMGALVYPGVTTNASVDAVLQGAELELQYDSGTWFGALAASLLETKIDDSDQGLASAPPDKVVGTIGRWFNNQATRIGARLTYAAEQDDVPEESVTTDSYTVLDLFSDHRFANGMRLAFGIGNVLDETYSIHPAVIHQPGRSFNINLSARF